MKLLYTNRAMEDIEFAFSWYEKHSKGLGFDFLDCVEASILIILNSPEIYQLQYSNYRGCVVRRFPFTVFYTIETECIVIHSVFNNRQDPRKRPQ